MYRFLFAAILAVYLSAAAVAPIPAPLTKGPFEGGKVLMVAKAGPFEGGKIL